MNAVSIQPHEFDQSPRIIRVGSLSDLLHLGARAECPIVLNADLKHDDLEKVAVLLGRAVKDTRTFGHIRAIRNDPAKSHSIAESVAAHPPHTDGTFDDDPPFIFLLYFEETDPAGGGVSEFLPLSQLLAELEPKYVKVLATQPVRMERSDDRGFTDSWTGPLLSHDAAGRWVFRWRYDSHVQPQPVFDETGLLSEAIARVRDLAESLPRLRYAAVKGDLVLVPNRTWLHGRTALAPDSSRLVYRVWIR